MEESFEQSFSSSMSHAVTTTSSMGGKVAGIELGFEIGTSTEHGQTSTSGKVETNSTTLGSSTSKGLGDELSTTYEVAPGYITYGFQTLVTRKYHFNWEATAKCYSENGHDLETQIIKGQQKGTQIESYGTTDQVSHSCDSHNWNQVKGISSDGEVPSEKLACRKIDARDFGYTDECISKYSQKPEPNLRRTLN